MSGTILDGKAETKRVLAAVGNGVQALAAIGKKPVLAAVLANSDPGSAWYAKAQAKHCEEHGVELRLITLSPTSSENEVVAAVEAAGKDPEVSAIIVFTPLPPNVSLIKVVEAIPPTKDAEGVHPSNMGNLLISSHVDPAPCTAMAALELIKTAKPNLSGARALVIGRSATVGKPLALLLLAEHATVTIAHTRSDLRAAMLEADIVVAAAGASGAKWRAYEKKWNAWKKNSGDRPEAPDLEPLVTMDMVRRGAVVIDIGDNNIPDSLDQDGAPTLNTKGKPAMHYAGDVDFDKVKDVAGFITNPRGSVGPLTNAFLLRNVVNAALLAAGLTKVD